ASSSPATAAESSTTAVDTTQPGAAQAAARPQRAKRKQKMRIPLSANDLDAVAIPGQEEAAVDYDAFEGEKQAIDAEALASVLPQLLDRLKEYPIAETAYASDHYEIKHNEWHVRCSNRLTMSRMQQVRPQLQEQLRKLLNNPSAIIRVHVDESLQEIQEDKRTLRREDVLKEMIRENTDLQQFIQHFDARIEY
ncbi:MAG: hypothetical protein ACOCZ8_06390, partial [Bacteroidota bacterium]